MFDVVTIGGATRDVTFATNKGKVIPTPKNLTEQALLAFEYGAKIRIEEVYFSPGGGAANTAVSLAKLGLKAAGFLRIGSDSDGLEIKNKLSKKGVNIRFVQTDKKIRTGTSFIIVVRKKGDRLIFSWRGANENLEIKEEKLKRLNSKWIYLTSLSGDWEKSLKRITSFVRKNKIKLAFNPGSAQIRAGRKKLSEIFKQTEILFLNCDEAIELVLSDKKSKIKNINNPVDLIKNINQWGPKVVIVTKGLLGAWIGDGKNIFHAPASSKKRVDTTGAGDAFGSGFLGGFIINQGEIKEALKYAIINSGNIVNYFGAQEGLLTRKEIEAKLKKIKVKKKV